MQKNTESFWKVRTAAANTFLGVVTAVMSAAIEINTNWIRHITINILLNNVTRRFLLPALQ
jgi:hypothetical protein